MNLPCVVTVTLAGALIAHCPTAWAFKVDTPPPIDRRAQPAPGHQAKEPYGSLREGVITDLRLDAGKVEIDGKWYTIVIGQTKVVRNGNSVPSRSLSKRQSVRFTLEGNDPARSVIEVVYVP